MHEPQTPEFEIDSSDTEQYQDSDFESSSSDEDADGDNTETVWQELRGATKGSPLKLRGVLGV